MKKVIILLVILLLLSACANQTEIQEDMLSDTHYVIDSIEDISENEREESADERIAFDQYKENYADKTNMTHDEKMVQSMTMNLLMLHNNKAVMESANETALEEVEEIRDYIKTGETKE